MAGLSEEMKAALQTAFVVHAEADARDAKEAEDIKRASPRTFDDEV